MKTTKTVLCGVVAALLGLALVSCAGAPARAEGDVIAVVPSGEWFAMDDQGPPDLGSSTIEMTEVEIDGMTGFHLAGEVTTTFEWGFAGFGLHPDDATLENLRATEAISFMVRGDGQRYSIQFQTTDVRDHGFFWVVFETEADEAIRVSIPMNHFMQPGWATPVGRLRQDRVTGLQWQTHESGRPGPFELTIWDVRLYVPEGAAVIVAQAPAAVEAAPAAGYAYAYYGEYQAY